MSSSQNQIPAFQKGNTALITGGASGIGLALAVRLLSYGLKVIVADKDASSLYRLSLSPETSSLIPFEMDVGKVEDWQRLKKKVEEEFDGTLIFSLFMLESWLGGGGGGYGESGGW